MSSRRIISEETGDAERSARCTLYVLALHFSPASLLYYIYIYIWYRQSVWCSYIFFFLRFTLLYISVKRLETYLTQRTFFFLWTNKLGFVTIPYKAISLYTNITRKILVHMYVSISRSGKWILRLNSSCGAEKKRKARTTARCIHCRGSHITFRAHVHQYIYI